MPTHPSKRRRMMPTHSKHPQCRVMTIATQSQPRTTISMTLAKQLKPMMMALTTLTTLPGLTRATQQMAILLVPPRLLHP